MNNLNEELLRTKQIMGLLSEAPTGVYHEWKECGGSVYSYNLNGILFHINGPGWNVGTQTGGSVSQPWTTHQNSEAFWVEMGQPSPGTVVGVVTNNSAGNSMNICLEYVGTVQSGSYHAAFGGANITNVTSYGGGGEGGCKECLGTEEQHSCIGGYCVVDPNGPHATLADCQACFNDPQCPCDNEMWKCVNKGKHPKFGKHCVSTNDGSGQYTSLQDCQASKECSQPLKADIKLQGKN